jgi:hypothetical protein
MLIAGAALAPAVLSAQSTPATSPLPRTVFFGSRPGGGFAEPDTTSRSAVADSAIPARVFEAMSAPFVTDSFAFGRAGRCVGLGDDGAAAVRGVLLSRTLSMLVPGSSSAAPGSRWMLVRRGTLVPGLGVVGTPTGIVRLTSGGTASTAARGEVVAQFDAISCDDAVFPMPYLPPPSRARPTVAADGARGRVAWVEGGMLLPTLQHALVVDIGTQAGVRAGDRVTIYAADGTIAAKANVVRADPRSATVRLVSQSLGALTTGLPVRVTEKLP